ncbi:hypothetical protein [Ktedonobacter racemifer]|nr:hypothetical protein [Ktedonobacter racemifer]
MGRENTSRLTLSLLLVNDESEKVTDTEIMGLLDVTPFSSRLPMFAGRLR